MRLRYSKAINRLRPCVLDTVSQQINQSLLLLRSLSHKEIRAGIAAYTGKPVDDEEVTKLINHVSETWRLFLFPNAGLLSAMHMETYGMFFHLITPGIVSYSLRLIVISPARYRRRWRNKLRGVLK